MHTVKQPISFKLTYLINANYCPKAVIISKHRPMYLPEMKYTESCRMRSHRDLQETLILTTMYCIRHNEILNEM